LRLKPTDSRTNIHLIGRTKLCDVGVAPLTERQTNAYDTVKNQHFWV